MGKAMDLLNERRTLGNNEYNAVNHRTQQSGTDGDAFAVLEERRKRQKEEQKKSYFNELNDINTEISKMQNQYGISDDQKSNYNQLLDSYENKLKESQDQEDWISEDDYKAELQRVKGLRSDLEVRSLPYVTTEKDYDDYYKYAKLDAQKSVEQKLSNLKQQAESSQGSEKKLYEMLYESTKSDAEKNGLYPEPEKETDEKNNKKIEDTSKLPPALQKLIEENGASQKQNQQNPSFPTNNDENKPVAFMFHDELQQAIDKREEETEGNYERIYAPSKVLKSQLDAEKQKYVVFRNKANSTNSPEAYAATEQAMINRIDQYERSYWDTYTDNEDFDKTEIDQKYADRKISTKSKKILSYLDQHGLEDEAKAYNEFLKYEEDKLENEIDYEGRKFQYSYDTMAAAGDSVWSAPANVIGGLLAQANNIYQMSEGKTRLNVYNGWHDLANYAINVRGAVTENIDSQAGKFAYQTGMSMADSTLTMALAAALGGAGLSTTGAGALAAIPLSSAAANQTTRSMLEEGYTPTMAFRMGMASGFSEWITEQTSIDSFFSNVQRPISTVLGKTVALVKQGLAEGLEEVASNKLNRIFEAAILGTMSHNNSAINYYMAKGYSKEEATKEVLKDNIYDDFTAFAGGFISGGLMAGSTATVMSQANVNRLGNAAIDNGTDMQIVRLATTMPENTAAYKAAIKIEDTGYASATKGNFASKIGKIAFLVDDYIKEEKSSAIYDAVYNRAIEIGSTKSEADAIATYRSTVATQGYANNADLLADKTKAERTVKFDFINEEYFGKNGRTAQWVTSLNKQLENVYLLESQMNEALNRPSTNANQMTDLIDTNKKTAGGYRYGDFDATPLQSKVDPDTISVSDTGKTQNAKTGAAITIASVSDVTPKGMTLKLSDGSIVKSSNVKYASQEQGMLYESVAKMNVNAEQANQIIKNYDPSSSLSVPEYIQGVSEGMYYGSINHSIEMIPKNSYFNDLSETQQNMAYQIGRIFTETQYRTNQEQVNDRVERGREKGIRRQGAIVYEGSVNTQKLTPRQTASVKVLGKIARDITHNTVHLYQSKVTKNGDFVFADQSSARAAGKKVGDSAPNGFYDSKTGDIWIDLNAGQNGEGTVLWTAAHEFVHFIKENSPAQFKTLADFLIDQYGRHGVSVEQLIQEQIDKAKRNGETISDEQAFEELAADAMQQMFTDHHALEKIAALKKKDKSLWQKLKNFIQKIKSIITQEYSKLNPDTKEAQYVAEMKDAIDRLSQLFAEGLVGAGDNYVVMEQEGTEEETSQESTANDYIQTSDESYAGVPSIGSVDLSHGTDVLNSVRTLEEKSEKKVMPIGSGKGKMFKFGATTQFTTMDILELISERNKNGEAKLKQIKSALASLSEYMKKAEVKYRFIDLSKVNNTSVSYDAESKKIIFSCMVKNGEYPVNFDFTTVCKKRDAASFFINELLNRVDENGERLSQTYKLTPENLKKLNDAMRESGYETACVGCFVEAKRYNIDSWSKIIVDEWNAEVKKYAKDAGYITEDGEDIDVLGMSDKDIDKVSVQISDAFSSKKKGKRTPLDRAAEIIGSDASYQKLIRQSDIITDKGIAEIAKKYPKLLQFIKTRYGTSTPKLAQGFTPYNSEIALLADNKGKTLSLADYLYSIGGIRSQSFSDFKIEFVLDYLQMFADAYMRDLPMHVYTKEISFAELFGKIGAKINMSVMFNIMNEQYWSEQEDNLSALGETEKNAQKLAKKYAGMYIDEDGKLMPLIADKKMAETFRDKTGQFLPVQSIGYEEAVELQKRKGYTGNVGIIGVGYGDYHVRVLLRDDNIRYVIPYHRSSLPVEIAVLTNIKYARDYTAVQNTLAISSLTENKKKITMRAWLSKNGFGTITAQNAIEAVKEFNRQIQDGTIKVKTKKAAAGHGDFNVYTGRYGVKKTKNPIVTVNRYVADCLKKGNLPMFYEFADEENYYKLHFDFNVFDNVSGEYAPQTSVGFDIGDVYSFIDKVDGYMSDYESYRASVYNEEVIDQTIESFKEKVDSWNTASQVKLSARNKSMQEKQQEVIDQIERENERLKEDIVDLKELLKLQNKQTHGKMITKSSITTVAKRLMKDASAKGDVAELSALLSDMYGYIQSGEDVNFETVKEKGDDIVKWLMSRVELKGELSDEAKDIFKMLKGTRVYVSPVVKAEANAFNKNGYNDIRKSLMGILTLTSDRSAIPLDSIWQEWASEYPNLFDSRTVDLDQLSALSNIVEDLKGTKFDISDQYEYYNDMIAQDLFSKVYDGFWDVATLYTVADKYAKKINEIKSKHKKTIDNIREQHKAKDEALKKRFQEEKEQSLAKYRERRYNTETRNKIKKLYHRIEKMYNNPTDHSYIPRDMLSAALDVLSVVDIRTGKSNKTQNALNELYIKYTDMATSLDDDLRSVYDKDLATALRDLRAYFTDTNIYAMSSEALDYVYETMKSIYETIMDAKKMLGESERMTIRESGMAMIRDEKEIIKQRGKYKQQFIGKRAFDRSTLFFLNSMRCALEIGGWNPDSEIYKRFEALNGGQKKQYDFMMKCNKKLDALVQTKEDQKAFDDAKSKKIDLGWGRLTKMQMAQILLTIEREKAIGTLHLKTGGFYLSDTKYNDVKKARDNATQYQIDVDEMERDIRTALVGDTWIKRYMDVAKGILRSDTKNAINETSQVLKHRDLAGDDYYIPFVSVNEFIVREIEALVRDATIEGSGFTKQTQKGATNPLYIDGLDVVLNQAINNAATYSGLAIPIRNLNRALNVKNDAEGISVKQAITNAWGQIGMQRINDALSDLQTGRPYDNIAWIDTLKSAYITSVLNGNISVAIKQAASLETAEAVLNHRLPAVKFAEFVKTITNYNSVIAEIDQHTSEHWRRRIGLSTDEVAAMTKNTGFFGKVSKKIPAAINGNKWIQMIDCWTTATIWELAKKDINSAVKKGKYNFKVGSDEYWNAVTAHYEEAVETTQPMYDPLHRSEMQKNNVTNKIFMFKTQPLQNAGMIYESAVGFSFAKKTGNIGLQKKYGTKLRKVMFAQSRSAVLFALMTMIASGIKGKMKRYKDEDEEKITFASFLNAITGDVVKTGVGLAAPVGGSELYDYFDAIANGTSWGKAVLTDPTLDWINSYASAISKLYKDPSAKNIAGLITKLGDLTGQPVTNLYNLIQGIGYNVTDIINGNIFQFKASEYDEKPKEKKYTGEDYAYYIKSGSSEKASGYYNDWLEKKKQDIADNREETGFKELSDAELTYEAKKAIKSSVSSYYRKQFQMAYREKDDRTMQSIRKQMQATGLYDNVVETCQKWIKDMKVPS